MAEHRCLHPHLQLVPLALFYTWLPTTDVSSGNSSRNIGCHLDPKSDWEQATRSNGSSGWQCKLCNDSRIRHEWHIPQHEGSVGHQALLALERQRQQTITTASNNVASTSGSVAPTPASDSSLAVVDSGIRSLLHSLTRNTPMESSAESLSPLPPDASVLSGFNWNLFEATEDTTVELTAEQAGVASIAQQLLDRLDAVSEVDSEDDVVEQSDSEQSPENPVEPTVTGMSLLSTVQIAPLCNTHSGDCPDFF